MLNTGIDKRLNKGRDYKLKNAGNNIPFKETLLSTSVFKPVRISTFLGYA